MSEVGEILALNIKRLRKMRGWTAEVLAERASMDVVSLRRIETQAQWVSRDSIKNICDALDTSPSELFRELDGKPRVSLVEAWTMVTEGLGIQLPKGALERAKLPPKQESAAGDRKLTTAMNLIEKIGVDDALRILEIKAKNEAFPEVQSFVEELEAEIVPLKKRVADLEATNAALKKELENLQGIDAKSK